MNVLFYEDPVTDRNDFTWRLGHVELDGVIYRNLVESGVNCRMVMSEQAEYCFAEDAGIAGEDRIVVAEAELMAALGDPQDRINHWFHDPLFSAPAPDEMPLDVEEEFVRRAQQAADAAETHESALRDASHHVDDASKLLLQARALDAARRLKRFFQLRMPANFTPDVIVSWVPVPFLRALYPGALILHREAGVFAQPPFPRTMYLDPVGFHSQSWICRNREASYAEEPAALGSLKQLRDHYLPLLHERSPFGFLEQKKAEHETLLLVAAQINNYFLWDRACAYRSQMQMIVDVLEQVPREWGVVVSQHPAHGKLSEFDEALLERRYPNVILDPEFKNHAGTSQYLLAHCDIAATVSSSVGLQALFWGKPLICLGDSHLTPFAFDPEQDMAMQRQANDEHIAWQLFHYCIPEAAADKPGFFRDYLASKLQAHARDPEPAYFRQPVLGYNELTEMLLSQAITVGA